MWMLVVAAAVGIRIYMVHLYPVGVWSKDGGSYAYSAFRWVHSGIWETDPRRGPVYSMFIALCGKLWGDVDSLMILQHVLGAFSVLLGVFCLRVAHGRAALLPLAACGYSYGVYGLPIHLEQLVRNETILFFFATLSLASWLFAIRWRQPHWLWITGAAAALVNVTKSGVWMPVPFIFVLATLWFWRKERQFAFKQIAIFVAAFAVLYIGVKEFKKHTLPPEHVVEPQDGLLLYGRTAQFTYLDGGIVPEIKAQIRDEVIDYQHQVFGDGKKAPHLDNNVILKTTVVPHLHKILEAQGKDAIALNALCRQLAIEAILTHPWAYAKQVLLDLWRLHLRNGAHFASPEEADMRSLRHLLGKLDHPDPIVQAPRTLATLDRIDYGDPFAFYHELLPTAWMFNWSPVLWTSLLWPLAFFAAPPRMRAWWLGAGGALVFHDGAAGDGGPAAGPVSDARAAGDVLDAGDRGDSPVALDFAQMRRAADGGAAFRYEGLNACSRWTHPAALR